jgi:hypothetical protein
MSRWIAGSGRNAYEMSSATSRQPNTDMASISSGESDLVLDRQRHRGRRSSGCSAKGISLGAGIFAAGAFAGAAVTAGVYETGRCSTPIEGQSSFDRGTSVAAEVGRAGYQAAAGDVSAAWSSIGRASSHVGGRSPATTTSQDNAGQATYVPILPDLSGINAQEGRWVSGPNPTEVGERDAATSRPPRTGYFSDLP